MNTKIAELEKSVEELENSEMEGKFLTFWTDKQLYGIPIEDVVQIVQMQEITAIPEFPSYAKGIINLRGTIIPIVDVRVRFGKEEIPYNEHTCIIVTSMQAQLVGFIVDSVEEVADIPGEEISQPPVMAGTTENSFLTGIGRHESRVILLLNAKKILSEDQMSVLQNTNL